MFKSQRLIQDFFIQNIKSSWFQTALGIQNILTQYLKIAILQTKSCILVNSEVLHGSALKET